MRIYRYWGPASGTRQSEIAWRLCRTTCSLGRFSYENASRALLYVFCQSMKTATRVGIYPALPLAIGAVEMTVMDHCDVAIIFSNDTDLLPAVEAITRLKGRPAVETAAWTSDNYHVRLRSKPSVFHHHLPERSFRAAQRCINYAHASQQ